MSNRRISYDIIRQRLHSNSQVNQQQVRWKYKPGREAAVLIPLCKVNNQASLLFTLRSSQLREHRGEVSFPGGKREDDEALVDTVLRETKEEIHMNPDELYGPFLSLPAKSGYKVTAFVGDLGSIEMAHLTFNPDEVTCIFTVPIEKLLESYQSTRPPPASLPYSWVIKSKECSVSHTKTGEPVPSTFTIWGLTGYFVYEFLTKIIIGSPTTAQL